jgi:hypothetical protein
MSLSDLYNPSALRASVAALSELKKASDTVLSRKRKGRELYIEFGSIPMPVAMLITYNRRPCDTN